MQEKAEADALQKAKTYLMSLQAYQRTSVVRQASQLGRFESRLILHQSVNATIVQAKDKETGKFVILKVLGISVSSRALVSHSVTPIETACHLSCSPGVLHWPHTLNQSSSTGV